MQHHVMATVYFTPNGYIAERLTCSCRSEATTAELAGIPSPESAMFGRRAICIGIRKLNELECLPLKQYIHLSNGQRVFWPKTLIVEDSGEIVSVDNIPTKGVTIR